MAFSLSLWLSCTPMSHLKFILSFFLFHQSNDYLSKKCDLNMILCRRCLLTLQQSPLSFNSDKFFDPFPGKRNDIKIFYESDSKNHFKCNDRRRNALIKKEEEEEETPFYSNEQRKNEQYCFKQCKLPTNEVKKNGL